MGKEHPKVCRGTLTNEFFDWRGFDEKCGRYKEKVIMVYAVNYVKSMGVAPTNRAKCRSCHRTIMKGEPIGIIDYEARGYRYSGSVCYKCIDNKMKDDLAHFKLLMSEVKKSGKKYKELMGSDEVKGVLLINKIEEQNENKK